MRESDLWSKVSEYASLKEVIFVHRRLHRNLSWKQWIRVHQPPPDTEMTDMLWVYLLLSQGIRLDHPFTVPRTLARVYLYNMGVWAKDPADLMPYVMTVLERRSLLDNTGDKCLVNLSETHFHVFDYVWGELERKTTQPVSKEGQTLAHNMVYIITALIKFKGVRGLQRTTSWYHANMSHGDSVFLWPPALESSTPCKEVFQWLVETGLPVPATNSYMTQVKADNLRWLAEQPFATDAYSDVHPYKRRKQ